MAMLNLRTESARKREAAQQVRLSLTLERPFVKQLRAEFARVAKAAAKEARTQHAVSDHMVEHRRRLASIFARHYRIVARAFITRVADAVSKSARIVGERKDDPRVPALSIEAAAVMADLWPKLGHIINRRAAQVAETTDDIIRRKVTVGLRDGATWADIARDVEDSGLNSLRAQTIAATEVHGATQAATNEAAGSLGLALNKQWVSVEDEHTRLDHVEANAQEVGFDGTFTIGGAPMAYPGDPSGPPEQVINCRCATVFNVQE